jgi:hypothetical protein
LTLILTLICPARICLGRWRYEPPEVTWGGAAAGVGTEFAGALFELELPELELPEPEPASSPEEGAADWPSSPAGDDEPEAPVLEAAPLLVPAE